jgi:alpha-D-ribose 1-methylphosphonate 5-triphosphate diphosphatase PhnM
MLLIQKYVKRSEHYYFRVNVKLPNNSEEHNYVTVVSQQDICPGQISYMELTKYKAGVIIIKLLQNLHLHICLQIQIHVR